MDDQDTSPLEQDQTEAHTGHHGHGHGHGRGQGGCCKQRAQGVHSNQAVDQPIDQEGRGGCCGKGHGKHGHGHGRGGCGRHGGHGDHGDHGKGHGHHHGHEHGGEERRHHFKPEVGREVDASWRHAMAELIDVTDKTVVDIGCGGGVYVRGWLSLGAATVIGVDVDDETLVAARDAATPGDGSTFVKGEAGATGLPDREADVVFIRAALHHLDDASAFGREAARLLRPGGVVIIQDWTEANHRHPGANDYPFGYQMDLMPQVREHRDHHALDASEIVTMLERSGLQDIKEHQIWETRYTYPTAAAYLETLTEGKERRFLGPQPEEDILTMIDGLRDLLDPGEIIDRDHWTVWVAIKP